VDGGGGRALLREVVVLGRHGGRGGRYRGELTVTVAGAHLMTHTTLLDGADAALSGPAGTAGARAVGTLLVVGCSDSPDGGGERPGLRWAWSALDGPGRVLLAVGDPGPVTALLAGAATSSMAARTSVSAVQGAGIPPGR
jgi:urease accessory protein